VSCFGASQRESGRRLPTKRATQKEQIQSQPCTQKSPHAYLTSDLSIDVSATPAHGVYVWSWYLGICVRLAPRSRHWHLHKKCSDNSNVSNLYLYLYLYLFFSQSIYITVDIPPPSRGCSSSGGCMKPAREAGQEAR